jgi:hypothetical protein
LFCNGDANVEYCMIGFAFVVGTVALWHGFTRHHHRLISWLLFTGGVIALIAKQVWRNWELIFLPVAVLLMVSAHVVNYRWCRAR